jgi:hypothetical protein
MWCFVISVLLAVSSTCTGMKQFNIYSSPMKLQIFFSKPVCLWIIRKRSQMQIPVIFGGALDKLALQ